MLAAHYAVLSNDRVRDHHDRAGQRARATDAAAHLRGRAGPSDGSHQTRAELAASASGAARMAGGRPAGPALLRAGSLAAAGRGSDRGWVGADRRPDGLGRAVNETPPTYAPRGPAQQVGAGRRPALRHRSAPVQAAVPDPATELGCVPDVAEG